MKIFLSGLVSVHWGRAEFGNVGNYYIVEATVRELHRVFPNAEIVTTFQMTEKFCQEERVKVLPLSYYYEWKKDDLKNALYEMSIATIYNKMKMLVEHTPFIDEVLTCDLYCDFSGEMWGDHAEPVGENRFLVNLLKNRTVQLLNIPTVLLAGSQGPFNVVESLKPLAHEVFKNFSLVLNREAASKEMLSDNGFDVSNVQSFTDPAFLFEPASLKEIEDIVLQEEIYEKNRPTVGFILCGFNMLEGPYDKEPRRDSEFIQFAEVIEFIINDLEASVFLMSHQNGFEKEPAFKFINGRDYPYAKQLYNVVLERGIADREYLKCAVGPFTPKETKAIIAKFDMFVSGRIHGFVAAVSQCVPTVVINRGHGGKSHRNQGFAESVGLENFISDPSSSKDMIEKIKLCFTNRRELKNVLEERIPKVKKRAHELFNSLKVFEK